MERDKFQYNNLNKAYTYKYMQRDNRINIHWGVFNETIGFACCQTLLNFAHDRFKGKYRRYPVQRFLGIPHHCIFINSDGRFILSYMNDWHYFMSLGLVQ